jgi:hypothetical protein
MNVTAKWKIKQKVQFKKNIAEHLLSLQEGLKKCFPPSSTNGIEWVISPFGASGEHTINIASDLTYAEKEESIGVSSDTTLNQNFRTSLLIRFGFLIKMSTPQS